DMTLQMRLELELSQINDSLHAMEEGTYGLCRVCSEPILYERLDALPTADTCLEHAEETEIDEEPEFKAKIEEYSLDELDTETDENEAWFLVSEYGTSDRLSDADGQEEVQDDLQ